MIRPIDTQILHPQTPEIAGRQQRANHLPVEQQSQFGDILKKDVEHKKDTVIAPQSSAHLKTDKDGSREQANQDKRQLKKKGKASNKKKDKRVQESGNKIDIRL